MSGTSSSPADHGPGAGGGAAVVGTEAPARRTVWSEDDLMLRLFEKLYVYKKLKGALAVYAHGAGDGAETPNVLHIEVEAHVSHRSEHR
jgi:hypothetical protein